MMYRNWIDSAKITHETGQDMWAVDFTAHPMLDPEFTRRPSRLQVLTRLAYRRILKDEDAYRHELARLFYPVDSHRAADATLAELKRRAAEYLLEADVYIASTIDLLPHECRDPVMPQAVVATAQDMRDLMGLSFYGDSERVRYEARRKLYLAQMLLQIDHTRDIQDGPAHMSYFENLLNEGIWKYTKQIHDMSIGFSLSDDGDHIRYSSQPGPHDQRWQFRSTFIEKPLGGRTIALDILYYNCRFKRAVNPISFEVIDGRHQVVEQLRWGEMRQQTSGSILSKMIRKGINNPQEIGDIIGAMFIVNDNDALNDLLGLLDSCIGAPLGWRNVTDTLQDMPDGSTLNDYSSKQYKVFKGDVDILCGDDNLPYRYPVEIQIYTLESYLRTVCGHHDANHLALKLRQFLYGLVPRIFPREIYGTQWLKPWM